MTSSRPPPLPPKRHDLVESFNAMALKGSPSPNQRKGSGDYNAGFGTSANNAFTNLHTNGFVGGFSPERMALNASLDAGRIQRDDYGLANSNGPFRVPNAAVSMPIPQVPRSRTMQYALGGSPPPTPPKSASPPKQPAPSTPPRPSKLAPPAFDRPRPSSDSALSPPNVKSPKTRKAKSTSPTETPEPAPCTPPRHKRATSSPPSPTLSAATSSPGKDSVRCSGFTKASQPCKRMVKVGPALATLDPDLDVERFCHQHRDEIGKQNGFTAFKNGQYVEFDTWIPKYLHPDTQAVLRAVMAKPKSGSDKDGYIYTYEIRDKHTPDVVHLKVGRATTLNQRLDQWQKQCSSKEQVVRGWWPASADGDEGSLLRGLIKAGPAGPLCHRLERLIHLELADLVVHTPYLDPHWPNVNHDDLAVSSKKNAKTALYKKNHQPCLDCGAVHKEIFSFKRVEEGYYENKEWELIVKPVIEKWGFFVETYV